MKVRVIKKNGKTFTVTTAEHTHDYKPVYKTVHHDAQGHYETVTVPAYDEEKTVSHDICLRDGRDLTQDYLDSVKNKTYPDYDEATKKEWGWTEENGYPKLNEDAAVFINENLEIDKWAPTYSMYMGLHGWNGECDGHNYSLRPVIIKIHHEASTKQEWKVDKKAYDEKILTGYQCACGKTK